MEKKNQKLYLAAIGLAVIALIVVVAFEPGSLNFRNDTDYERQAQLANEELRLYEEFLASLEPNYTANQQFLQKIATEDLVRKEVEETLQTKQRITIPTLATAELNIQDRTDRDSVVNYFNKTKSMLDNYQQQTQVGQIDIFSSNSDANRLASVQEETRRLITNLRTSEVPKPLTELHKSTVLALSEYEVVFGTAAEYARGPDFNPWSTVYNKYAVIDNRLGVVKNELNKLNQTYAILPAGQEALSFSLVKTAHAQFGLVTVGTDWQMILYEGIKTGLARAFTQFAMQMIDKLVSHIEKNFAIASQLYYSQELGRFYSVEYLKKFVQDPLDQEIITKFIPEYFCVSPDKRKLRQIFVAKARQNVGNDLVINPADPDFFNKLARLGGDEKNYPVWWEGYYESLAVKTKLEADIAANKEVLSPGVKTGRDIISNQVQKTVSSIMSVQQSAISGAMDLGTGNADNIAGELVAGIVQNLVNKFLFTPLTGGQSSGPGGIGIIAERDVCLATAAIKPLIPLPSTKYEKDSETAQTIPSTPPFNPNSPR